MKHSCFCSGKESVMASKMTNRNLKSAMGFYYTYAAFYFEGYFAAPKRIFR